MHAFGDEPGKVEPPELSAQKNCEPAASGTPTRRPHAMRDCRSRACAGAAFDLRLRVGQDCRSTEGMWP